MSHAPRGVRGRAPPGVLDVHRGGILERASGLPVVLVVDEDVDDRLHLVSIPRRNGFPCASTSPAPLALRVSRLLGDVRRVLPAARVMLFVSLEDVAPASL